MRRGQLLLAAVYVLVIVSVLGLFATSFISTGISSHLKNLSGVKALNLAEGGMKYMAACYLAGDTDWSDNATPGWVALGAGDFLATYVSRTKNFCRLEVTGRANGSSRVIRADFRRGEYLMQFSGFGLYAGEEGDLGDRVTFLDQSKIIGNFYYYGPIRILGPRPPACQSGGVIKSASISPSPAVGVPNYYESWEAINSVDIPPWINRYYDNWLTVAIKAGAGDLTLAQDETLDLAGGTRWYHRVTLKDNATLTGPGTLCATENLSANNYSRFINPVRLVVRGKADFNHNVSWSGRPEIIVKEDLTFSNNAVTPAESILYSREDVTLNNNVIVQGSVLAPLGKVSNKNNGYIRGLVFAKEYEGYNSSTLEGGAVFEEVGDFYNESMVIQNNAALPSVFPAGISTEGMVTSFEVSNWHEVY